MGANLPSSSLLPFTDFTALLSNNNAPSDLEIAVTRDAFVNGSDAAEDAALRPVCVTSPSYLRLSPGFYQYSPTFLPWEQITHCRALLPAQDLLDTLRAASSLDEAVLQSFGWPEAGVNVTPPPPPSAATPRQKRGVSQ
ncbi:hypothetical protein DFH06DRAFT_1317762 [Mycena polygramma]|nr:hypothetical protein DFH06DRAFT_1317762 [Mycena polygramma]